MMAPASWLIPQCPIVQYTVSLTDVTNRVFHISIVFLIKCNVAFLLLYLAYKFGVNKKKILAANLGTKSYVKENNYSVVLLKWGGNLKRLN